MSNETKRDVFEVALNHATKTGWVDYGQLSDRYAAALPDNLPVIPEAVGEMLRSSYGKTNLLGVLETARNGRKISYILAWMFANQNASATAWVLGAWYVEGTGEIVKLEEIDDGD